MEDKTERTAEEIRTELAAAPRCEKCGGSMRRQPDGWECRRCGRIQKDDGSVPDEGMLDLEDEDDGPEPNWRVEGQDGGRDEWLTVEVYADSEDEAHEKAHEYMSDIYSAAPIEDESTSSQTKSDGPFASIVDEHDGQLDLRATITMPNGFMVEVAIEDVMGSPDVALYAGPGEGDPERPIPGELVGRWDVARLMEG